MPGLSLTVNDPDVPAVAVAIAWPPRSGDVYTETVPAAGLLTPGAGPPTQRIEPATVPWCADPCDVDEHAASAMLASKTAAAGVW